MNLKRLQSDASRAGSVFSGTVPAGKMMLAKSTFMLVFICKMT